MRTYRFNVEQSAWGLLCFAPKVPSAQMKVIQMTIINLAKSEMSGIPSRHEVDLQIASARRAQSEAIKRIVVGSISAIDRRFLHRA